jgi:ketosteroid isomerase-like protein
VRNMRLAVLIVICFLSASLAWSQAGNAPASSGGSGQTSGSGQGGFGQGGFGEGGSGGSPKVSQHLIALENKWTEAVKKGDADTVAPLLADNYVTTDADSSMHNKTEALARIRSDKWVTNEISDLKVAAYSNTAVVTGTWIGKGTASGKAIDAHERWTDTWVKMPDGKWQCVASHSSSMK